MNIQFNTHCLFLFLPLLFHSTVLSMESPLPNQDKRILQNQQTIQNKPNLFKCTPNNANRAKQAIYKSAYCPPAIISTELPRLIGKKLHSDCSTPIVKSSQNRNKNIYKAASHHDNIMISSDESQYRSLTSSTTKEARVKIRTLVGSPNKPFEHTLSKQQNYITELEKQVISQQKEIAELRNVREKEPRLIHVEIQSNANSSISSIH